MTISVGQSFGALPKHQTQPQNAFRDAREQGMAGALPHCPFKMRETGVRCIFITVS